MCWRNSAPVSQNNHIDIDTSLYLTCMEGNLPSLSSSAGRTLGSFSRVYGYIFVSHSLSMEQLQSYTWWHHNNIGILNLGAVLLEYWNGTQLNASIKHTKGYSLGSRWASAIQYAVYLPSMAGLQSEGTAKKSQLLFMTCLWSRTFGCWRFSPCPFW